jgi:glyoxylase-like metal-dependent hydrolase (beta-lactamase superfamily II)
LVCALSGKPARIRHARKKTYAQERGKKFLRSIISTNAAKPAVYFSGKLQQQFAAMTQIVSFCFNPFQENTYVAYDETGECCIVDPGCYSAEEKSALLAFIRKESLKPVLVLNTHCHVDHVFGNALMAETFGLQTHIHKGEIPVLNSFGQVCAMYGLTADGQPAAIADLKEVGRIGFGNTQFEILFTPGHSPASVCFFLREEKKLISGDVLFLDSIGRHDLPGGNLETLMSSIFSHLMTLDDETEVFPGHGPATTIGRERKHNPFLLAWERGERGWL